METIICKYKENIKIKNASYYLLEDINTAETYPVPASEFTDTKITSDTKFKCIKESTSSGKHFIIPLTNKNYEVGKTYLFEIVDNNRYPNSSTIKVKDLSGQVIDVLAKDWQFKDNWPFNNLNCEVISFRKQTPKLLNKDIRHAIFEIDKVYDFTVIEIVKKPSKVKEENKFIKLKGVDGCFYLVPMMPGQDVVQAGETIKCEIITLRNELKLKQLNWFDPFFAEAEKIILNKSDVSKFFTPYITQKDPSFDVKRFQEQYNSQSAFWIITYCDKILPIIFNEYITRLDYKNAAGVNNLITVFEEWITKKGLIKSFTNIDSRKEALTKAEIQTAISKVIAKVLDTFILSHGIPSSNIIKEFDVTELYYYLKFCDIENVDEIFLIPQIIVVFGNINEKIQWQYLRSIEKIVTTIKGKYIIREDTDNFNIVINRKKKFLNDKNQDKYFRWSYCHYVLNTYLGNYPRANLVLTKMLKEMSHMEKNVSKRQNLIQTSFYLLNNITQSDLRDLFILRESVRLNKKYEGVNLTHKTYDPIGWQKLNTAFNTKEPVIVNVINKTNLGCDIIFENVKGFISYSEITEVDLKQYQFEEIDFAIAVDIVLLCEDFNYFIAKPLSHDHPNHFIKNNKLQELKIGMTCDAYTRKIKSYGVFLNTIFGSGLLHVRQISSHIWDENRLKKHFPPNKAFKVQILQPKQGGLLEFSLKGLEATEFKNEYFEFIEKVEDDYLLISNESNSEERDGEDINLINNSIHYEKANCFEQYAILQTDLDYKIELLFIAKQFHSSVNNARSYLLNIFIEFFQILQQVRKAIEDYSIQSWEVVKQKALITKDSINLKTIEIFPDANNLIYFLDIVTLFNDSKDENIERLFQYIRNYSNDTAKKSLKTIAKIALSNNLMISEASENIDFSLKNLKLIYSYLQSGILSLDESENDRLKRELEVERKYWKGIIRQDEGQSLEFKQSLFVPNYESKKDGFVKELSKKDFEELDKKRKKTILHSAFKSLCAFANSHGGTLMLGVCDNKKIAGLETDYNSLSQSDRDGFGKRFDDEIKKYFGDSFSHLLDKKFLLFDEGDVLIIKVKPSHEEVFLLKDEEGKSSEELYIRNLSSVEQLKGKELAKFIKRRQLEQLKNSV